MSRLKTENVTTTTPTEMEISKKPLKLAPVLEPLGSGQKYFEAPDGTIMIGEADKDRLWYRKGNGGKGMWINPRR